MERRNFLKLSTGAGALSLSSGCASQPGASKSTEAETGAGPSAEELDRAAARPVLKLEGATSPVVIDSIRLLRKDRDYFIHVRSKDGAEGISLDNGRAEEFYPILNERVVPYFIGKDVRDLVQSSRSKPTAFQAVSFERGLMAMRRRQSSGGMWAAERCRDSDMARVTDPPSHFVAPPKDSKARQPGILKPAALQPGNLQAASAASRLSVVNQPTGFQPVVV